MRERNWVTRPSDPRRYSGWFVLALAVCYPLAAAVPPAASDVVAEGGEQAANAEPDDSKTSLTAELESLQHVLTEAVAIGGSGADAAARAQSGEAFRLERRRALLEKMQQRKQAATQAAIAAPSGEPPTLIPGATVRAAAPPQKSAPVAPAAPGTPPKLSALTSLEVTFDKRGGTALDSSGSDVSWVSRVAGLITIVETSILTRVEGRDQAGTPVSVEPEWSVVDPTQVTVSPSHGSLVRLSIHGPGASNLIVRAGNITKSLIVSAGPVVDGALVVDILQ